MFSILFSLMHPMGTGSHFGFSQKCVFFNFEGPYFHYISKYWNQVRPCFCHIWTFLHYIWALFWQFCYTFASPDSLSTQVEDRLELSNSGLVTYLLTLSLPGKYVENLDHFLSFTLTYSFRFCQKNLRFSKQFWGYLYQGTLIWYMGLWSVCEISS